MYLKDLFTSVLSRAGIHISRASAEKDLRALLRKYWPVDAGYSLRRIGGLHDGGYLVPDCLEGLTVCLSPGVDRTAEFERELAGLGIGSHLIDKSVAGPPDGFAPLSFTKKFLGPVTRGEADVISMQDWLTEIGETGREDLLLQMDIEGAEYASLLATPPDILSRFRVIILELHNLNALGNRAFLQVFSDFTDMLLKDHVIVHAHPNNVRPPVQVGKVTIHPYLEITLLRQDLVVEGTGSYRHDLPHPLDSTCVPGRADVTLAADWIADAC